MDFFECDLKMLSTPETLGLMRWSGWRLLKSWTSYVHKNVVEAAAAKKHGLVALF